MDNDYEQSRWIESRLKRRLKVYDQGNKLNFRCPLCGDSKRNTSKKRGYFYKANGGSLFCFNCNTTLIGLNVISNLENRSYKDVREEYLRDKYGKNFKFNKKKDFKKLKKNILDLSSFTDKLPEHIIKYLKDRKILEAPFLDPNVEFQYDSETKRLVIPWYYKEDIVYYQKRCMDDNSNEAKYEFPFNIDKTVYNIDIVDPSFPYIFILEGAFDAIFVKNGVAIGGKNLTDTQLKMLTDRWPKHKLVYFLDNHRLENTGRFNMVDHLLKIAKTKPSSKFLLWPDAMYFVKDVNQWIMAGGKNIFTSRKWLEQNIISSLKLKFQLSISK